MVTRPHTSKVAPQKIHKKSQFLFIIKSRPKLFNHTFFIVFPSFTICETYFI